MRCKSKKVNKMVKEKYIYGKWDKWVDEERIMIKNKNGAIQWDGQKRKLRLILWDTGCTCLGSNDHKKIW